MDTAAPESAVVKTRTISAESAQEQIDLFLDFYFIKPEIIDDEDQQSAVQTMINKVKVGIQEGLIEVAFGDELIVKQHTKYTQNKTVFEYHEFTGAVQNRIDKMTGAGRTKKIQEALGMMSKKPAEEFKNFRGADKGLMEALGTLFLFAS